MKNALRAIRHSTTNWEAIRDLHVRHAALQSEIDRCRLDGERIALEERGAAVEREIARMGETEAGLAAHGHKAARWWWLSVLAAGIAIAGAWWSANWFLSLTWEKALLSATLFVLPLIGWLAFLTFLADRVQDRDLRKVFVGLAFVIILASTTAVASLGGARMIGVALQEERSRTEVSGAPRVSSEAELNARLDHLETTKRLLSRLTMVAVVFLSVAGEVAAGVAYHQYQCHKLVVRTVAPFYKERRRLIAALVENATAQEEARRRPDMLHAELTATGLAREEAERRRAEEREHRLHSLAPTLRWVAIGFVVFLALLITAGWASGATDVHHVTGVLLDCSSSTGAAEFEADVRAVEHLILSIPAGRVRLVVFPINERSFQSRPLFVATSPVQAGRFDEYREAWQAETVAGWRAVAAGLAPKDPGSEILGGLNRVALEFADYPDAEKHLIVFSDMRQVGQGFNFERAFGDPKAALETAHQRGLIAQFAGVKVWLLGVHTDGLDERLWNHLKLFWTAYFRQAGAEVKAFSPGRRLPGT